MNEKMLENIENIICTNVKTEAVIIFTDKGLMKLKDFILKSRCFEENGGITLTLNKKVRLVSNGEGGNRHIYVETMKYGLWWEAAHLWFDIHGVNWVSVRWGHMTPKSLKDIIFWCCAKNGVRQYDNCWKVDINGMSKIILDLMTYIR